MYKWTFLQSFVVILVTLKPCEVPVDTMGDLMERTVHISNFTLPRVSKQPLFTSYIIFIYFIVMFIYVIFIIVFMKSF